MTFDRQFRERKRKKEKKRGKKKRIRSFVGRRILRVHNGRLYGVHGVGQANTFLIPTASPAPLEVLSHVKPHAARHIHERADTVSSHPSP